MMVHYFEQKYESMNIISGSGISTTTTARQSYLHIYIYIYIHTRTHIHTYVHTYIHIINTSVALTYLKPPILVTLQNVK